MAGLQCHKRFYFGCYNRELSAPVNEAQQAVFDDTSMALCLAESLIGQDDTDLAQVYH